MHLSKGIMVGVLKCTLSLERTLVIICPSISTIHPPLCYFIPLFTCYSSICGVRVTCILPLSYRWKMIQCTALSFPRNENRFRMHGDCLLEVQFCFAQYIMSYDTVIFMPVQTLYVIAFQLFHHRVRPK